MESPHLQVIRIWAAMAWADGVIAKSEAAAIRKLIDGTQELSDAEREVARGYLENRVELDTEMAQKLSVPAREGIYRAAVRLSTIDNVLADEETAFLGRLRKELALSDDTARKIEKSVPPILKK